MAMLKSMFRLLCVAAVSIAAIAQEPQPAVPGNAHGPIHLNVVVTPHSGAPVGNLPQSAFTVLDNGKPQPIQSFRAIAGQSSPVNVTIVIDAVNIPYIQLAYERNQIDSFLKSNDGKLAHPTSVAVFTDTSLEATGFTTSGPQLSQSLAQKTIGLRDLRRSAGFWGAAERLQMSVKGLQTVLSRERTLPGRKVVIWVSPGWPYLSGPNVQLSGKEEQQIFQDVVSISNMMRQSNTTLYAVDPLGAQENPGRTFYYEEFLSPIRKPSQAFPGDLSLQVLAIQSGGQALSGSNDIRGLLQQCIENTSAFYEITYMPPPSDAPDQFHKVDVKISEPGLTAHTMAGYYSNP